MIDIADQLSSSSRVVLVIGAGKTSTLKALEDPDHEMINSLPISLMPRLVASEELLRPAAVVSDTRTRDFDADCGCVPFFEFMTGFFKPLLER